MPVPTSPQDLINIIREKLFNNTSGLIEEPDLREVLENIVKVLDAKFSMFSPNLTEEQFAQWNLILDYMANETKGLLSPTSPAPTEKGKYILSSAGTYTNLGGLVATADKLNYAYFDGTTWSLISVDVNNAKTIFDDEDNVNLGTMKATADYFKNNFEGTFVEKIDEPLVVETLTTTRYDESAIKSNYSSLANYNIAHYNVLNVAPKDGKLKSVKVWCVTAGTIRIVAGTGRTDVAEKFTIRAEVGVFNLTAGTNVINLDFNVLEGETIAINSGTAIIGYVNSGAYEPGNRFVQHSIISDSLPTLSGNGVALLFQTTFEYYTGQLMKEKLNEFYVKKVDFTPSNFSPAIKTTEITVNTSQGNNAVQLALNSITDNSKNNRYTINVENGIYKIASATDFLGNVSNNYPAMIVPKDYVDIKGQSKSSTIIWAELPYDDSVLASQTVLARDKFQTIWGWANESKISNITFIGKNMRYVLHQDNTTEANKTRYYDNCDFIFLGNKGFTRALGIGTYSGSKTYLSNGKASSPARAAFSIHNNIKFSKPSLWQFDNFYFENLSGSTANGEIILIQNSGSMQDCEIILNNCSSNQFIINYDSNWLYQLNQNDCFNYANFRVKGEKNIPIFFNNRVAGKALMVKSKSTGLTSKVRFDTSSTAYTSIISNPYNYWGVLGHPERFIQDKYVAFDGAIGLSGYAIGGKSIIEGNAGNGVAYQCSLGKRLGDCSTTNKTLGIIIDGTNYNVVFNKNYTAMTNAQIITEINDVIGTFATASEYNIGGDYYAEFTDVLFEGVNASTSTFIPKGTLVTMKNNRLSPCGETDVLFGLAIDDIPPYRLDSEGVIYGKGRVIKNCYITIESDKVQSVLNSGTGTKYKIVNGSFVADVNGSYNLVDNKYLKI